jgi:hypothetical protein
VKDAASWRTHEEHDVCAMVHAMELDCPSDMLKPSDCVPTKLPRFNVQTLFVGLLPATINLSHVGEIDLFVDLRAVFVEWS